MHYIHSILDIWRHFMNTKRLITTSIFALISASTAQAADVMIPHQPTPVTSSTSAFVAPAFTWEGFYFGGQGGGFSSKTDMSIVGKHKIKPLSKDLSPKLSGFEGGLYAGSNIDLGDNFVLSIDTDFTWSGQKHTKTITIAEPENSAVDGLLSRVRKSTGSVSEKSSTTTVGTTSQVVGTPTASTNSAPEKTVVKAAGSVGTTTPTTQPAGATTVTTKAPQSVVSAPTTPKSAKLSSTQTAPEKPVATTATTKATQSVISAPTTPRPAKLSSAQTAPEKPVATTEEAAVRLIQEKLAQRGGENGILAGRLPVVSSSKTNPSSRTVASGVSQPSAKSPLTLARSAAPSGSVESASTQSAAPKTQPASVARVAGSHGSSSSGYGSGAHSHATGTNSHPTSNSSGHSSYSHGTSHGSGHNSGTNPHAPSAHTHTGGGNHHGSHPHAGGSKPHGHNPHASSHHGAQNAAGRSAQGATQEAENASDVYGIEQIKEMVSELGLEDNGTIGTLSHTLKQNWAGATRVRIGFAADRFMPYVAGGVAYTQLQDTISVSVINDDGTVIASKNLTDETKTMVGYTVGGGVDFAMLDNVILRAEYRYSDFGKKKFAKEKLELKYRTNEFRVGVAYKF